MSTNHLTASGPDLESSLPIAEADDVSLTDEPTVAPRPHPKSVWSRAFKFSTIVVTVSLLAWLGNLVLAGTYIYEKWEQRTLAAEIEATLASISVLPDSHEVQHRLTHAQMDLDAERGVFSAPADSPEVTQKLLYLAESVGVAILEVATEPGDAEEVGQNTYGSLLVNLEVAGSTGALAAFLYELEQGILPGGRVDEVIIEEITLSGAGAPEDRAFEGGTEDSAPGWSSHPVLASVAFTVYEMQGSWD